MPKIRFTKMHGGGNDFVVIDAVTQKVSMQQLSAVAMRLADRRLGIGCDQILILREPKKLNADFEYQIINADGSEVGQCGNGARCAHAFLRQRKLTNKRKLLLDKRKLLLHTRNTTIMTESTHGDKVQAHLAVPQFTPRQIPIAVTEGSVGKAKSYTHPEAYNLDKIAGEIRPTLGKKEKSNLPPFFMALSLGNPHAVFLWRKKHVLEDDEAGKLLHKLGRSLNRQRIFFPEGVNVGFLTERHDHMLDVRVYERGVGETPSCGSGAAAAALVWQDVMKIKEPVQVRMQGGILTCHWPQHENPPAPVWLEGDINFVFDGEFSL